MPARDYWRLAGFYFFYFALVGIWMPYWPLYLAARHLDAAEVGELMALFGVMRIFSPNLWGYVADRTGRLKQIIQALSLATVLAFALLFAGRGFAWLFLAMVLVSFFWNASLPLAEMTTLSRLAGRHEGYGRVRLWGSIGFIVVTVAVGFALNGHLAVDRLPGLAWLLMLGILAAASLLPTVARPQPHALTVPAWQVLRQPAVMALVSACFLMAVAHGAFYTFYSLYLIDHGYASTTVGLLWSLGVVAEIVLFMLFPRLARRFALPQILLACFALATVRFLMIAWGVDSLLVVVVAQLLHAASFAAYHAAAVALFYRYFTGRSQATGQALYNGFAYGAGGTVGSLYSGYTWEHLGGAWTLTLAAACTLLGFILLRWRLPAPPAPAG